MKIIFLILLFTVKGYSNYKIVKEHNISYLLLTQKKDSILEIEYEKAKVLFESKNYDKALNIALKLKDLSFEKNNRNIEYLTTLLIGEIFRGTNSIKKSLSYYKQALEIENVIALDKKQKKINDSNLANNLLMIAGAFQLLEKNDSAKYYYNKIIKLNSLSDDVITTKARAYTNLSGIYFIDSLYNKAKDFANEAIEIHRKQGNKLFLSESLSNLANIYLVENKTNIAKEYYFEAIKLIEKDKNLKAIKNKELFYDNLAFTLYRQKNYIAYEYSQKSFTIRDSLREAEVRTILAEIEAKHNYENDRKIEVAKRLKNQRYFLIIGVTGLVVIFSLGYWLKLNKLKQKNLALSLTQNELIKNQEIEKLKSESQTRILNATIDGKESERKHIAETLHDSVSALLSSAHMQLQATSKQFNGSTPVEIHRTQKLIEEASHKVRDLSHNLVSSVLLKFGLNFAIRDIAEKYSNSELTIHSEIGEVRRYEQNFEIKVHNIIQEFVNNIIKHSKADTALIALKEENNQLFLTVSDDGIGFDKTKVGMKDGLGINQIEARIQMMKGKFNIESSENNGTTISVEIPIVEKEELNLV